MNILTQQTLACGLLFTITFLPLQAQNLDINRPISNDSTITEGFQYVDLKPLGISISDSRFVMLGEPDHESANVIEEKIRVLKYLHEEMGFDMIAFESGFYDLKKANDDIKSGEDVKLALANSIFSIWTNSKEFLPFIEYIENNRNIDVVGFDSQFSGKYMDTNLMEDLRISSENSTEFQQFEPWLDVVDQMANDYSIPSETSLSKFLSIHNKIEQRVEKWANLSNTRMNKDFALQLLKNIKLTAIDYATNNTGKKSQKDFVAKDSNLRDSLMASNLIFLANKYPDKKIICWGATAHFSNRPKALNNHELSEYKPMGGYIKDAFGEDAVYILGFTGSRNIDSTYKALTFEKERHESSFLNLKSLPKGTEFYSSALSFEPDSPILFGDWKQVLDGLFYVGHITKVIYRPLDLTQPTIQETKTLTYEKPKQTYEVLNKEDVKKQNLYQYAVLNGGIADFHSLSGQVVDKETGNGIPFTTIGIPNTFIGTSSDEKGFYSLKIPRRQSPDSFHISCIGYQSKKISTTAFSNLTVIELEASNIELAEIQISANKISAHEFMKRVIDQIESNYTQEPYSQTQLIRKRYLDKKDKQYYIHETLIESYDNDGYKAIPMYPIRYRGFHNILNARVSQVDTLTGNMHHYVYNNKGYRGYAGHPDIIEDRFNSFLNPNHLKKYQFEFINQTDTNSTGQIFVKFRSVKPTHKNTTKLAPISYTGTITINEEDYAILNIETNTIQDKENIWNAKENPAYISEPIWHEKQMVSYRKIEGLYYFDHYRLISNWTTQDGGFLEIIGLEVKAGLRERPDEISQELPKEGIYNPDDWIMAKQKKSH